VFSDRGAAARAPFYATLRALGLARSVRASLLEDGAHHGLRASRSGAAEWAARAAALADNEQHELAAQCFARAGDGARALAAHAAAHAAAAAAAAAGDASLRERRELYIAAADAYLTAAAHAPAVATAAPARAVAAAAAAAAVKAAAAAAAEAAAAAARAQDAPAADVAAAASAAAAAAGAAAAAAPLPADAAAIVPASAAERSSWLLRAAASFARGANFGAAAHIFTLAGQHARAGACLSRAGAHRAAAAAFEKAAAAASGDAATRHLVSALRALASARASLEAVALLERVPRLAAAATAADVDVDRIAIDAAKAHHAAGRHEGVLAAMQHLTARTSRAERERHLALFGCWRELADAMPDASAASALLLTHVGPAAAAERLRAALPASPALRPRAHALLMAAAAREAAAARPDAAAKHAAAAAALWPSATAGGVPCAEAKLLLGALRRDAGTLRTALAAFNRAGSAPGQLAALSALGTLPGATLSAAELIQAPKLITTARTALRGLATPVRLRKDGERALLAQWDAFYGGLGLAAAGAIAHADAAATVSLRPEEYHLAAAAARIGSSASLALGPRAAAALAATAAAVAHPACPPPKPPPRAVTWRGALALVVLDTHAKCAALLAAAAAQTLAASAAAAAAGDGAAAAEAALAALTLVPSYNQLFNDADTASHRLGGAPDAFPSSPQLSASLAAQRVAASSSLRAALFPAALPAGASPAALAAFASAGGAPRDAPRAVACVAAVRTWEMEWDARAAAQRTPAHDAALWRVYTLPAPVQLEQLRTRVRIARRNAEARARQLGGDAFVAAAALAPTFTVRGEPHSPPLALLLAAADAARDGNAAGAAQAMLHFLDAAALRAPLPMHAAERCATDADWSLPLLELAAAAALTALGATQPVLVPSAWLAAYNRLAGKQQSAGKAPPAPRLPGAAAPAEAAASAADAVAALARALRVLLAPRPTDASDDTATATATAMQGLHARRASMLPLCCLLSATLPDAPRSALMAPLEHIAWRHVESLAGATDADADATAAMALARAKPPPPRRDVLASLFALASAAPPGSGGGERTELTLLAPGAPALIFDRVAPLASLARDKQAAAQNVTYAAPLLGEESLPGALAAAAAALLAPPSAAALRVFGARDAAAPSEAQHAAACVMQRLWRARAAAAAASQRRAAAAVACGVAARGLAREHDAAGGALRRWAAEVRATLSERRLRAEADDFERARAADRAASYAQRLHTIAAAAAAPPSAAACPLCARSADAASASAAAPAAPPGLRAGAYEFVPIAAHLGTAEHGAAAAAFASYEAVYLSEVCPAFAAADAVVSDSALEAHRDALRAVLDDVEARRAWRGAPATVRAALAPLRAATAAVAAWMQAQAAQQQQSAALAAAARTGASGSSSLLIFRRGEAGSSGGGADAAWGGELDEPPAASADGFEDDGWEEVGRKQKKAGGRSRAKGGAGRKGRGRA
jgi:hypothetical protein